MLKEQNHDKQKTINLHGKGGNSMISEETKNKIKVESEKKYPESSANLILYDIDTIKHFQKIYRLAVEPYAEKLEEAQKEIERQMKVLEYYEYKIKELSEAE